MTTNAMRQATAKMQELLEAVDLPSIEIHCFGSQIHITTPSREAADNWADFVSNFANVRNIIETMIERAGQDGMPRKRYKRAYRLYANI